MPVEIVRRTHGARFRRPRHELAQPVPDGRRASTRAKIYATLQAAANRMRSGDVDFASIETRACRRWRAPVFRLDYFCVRQAADLGTPAPAARELVVLTAVRLGRARLIDNVQVSRS